MKLHLLGYNAVQTAKSSGVSENHTAPCFMLNGDFKQENATVFPFTLFIFCASNKWRYITPKYMFTFTDSRRCIPEDRTLYIRFYENLNPLHLMFSIRLLT